MLAKVSAGNLVTNNQAAGVDERRDVKFTAIILVVLRRGGFS